MARSKAATQGFKLYGPTCDSLDAMEGPFVLPADIREGDYIEFGMLGAYGVAMTDPVQRFWRHGRPSIVKDLPWTSMYSVPAGCRKARGLGHPSRRSQGARAA